MRLYLLYLYNNKINITLVMQGIVASRFRYGGQYNNQFVENLNLNATVKEFKKSANICQSCGQRRGPRVFLCFLFFLHFMGIVCRKR